MPTASLGLDMPDPDRPTKFDLNLSEESWQYAGAFADSLGTMPSSVSSLVRALLSEADESDESVSSSSTFLLSRFLNSPSLQAAYFYSLAYLKPSLLGPANEPFTKSSFLRSYSAPEHAFMLSVLFLHRQARKATPSDQFASLTRSLQAGLNVGWLIGAALPAIGSFVGLLVGSYRWLGAMTFLHHDPTGFKSYFTSRKTRSSYGLDSHYELSRWNCCSAQVGMLLLQRAGIRPERIDALLGLSLGTSLSMPSSTHTAYYAVENWLGFFLDGTSFPKDRVTADYYLNVADQRQIIDRLANTDYTTKFNWLSATIRDITPEATPQLFAAKAKETEAQLLEETNVGPDGMGFPQKQ